MKDISIYPGSNENSESTKKQINKNDIELGKSQKQNNDEVTFSGENSVKGAKQNDSSEKNDSKDLTLKRDHSGSKNSNNSLSSMTETETEEPEERVGYLIGRTRTIANNCNLILGSGILSLPKAFQESYYYPGLVLLLLVCCMADFVCVTIIKLAKIKKSKVYEELAEMVLGKIMYYVICIFCIIYSFGGMMGYSQIVYSTIRSLLSDVMKSKSSSEITQASVGVTIAAFAVFVLPFVYFRDLSKLSWMSMLSVSTFGVIVVILLVTGIRINRNGHSNFIPLSFRGFLTAFGALSFALVCTDSVFPVYRGLIDNTMSRWSTVMHTTVIFIAIVYGFFATLCFFLIPNLDANVLNSPSISNLLEIKVAKILLSITLLLTFLTKVHVARGYIFSIISKSYMPITNLPKKQFMAMHFGVTSLIIVFNVAIGIAVGDLLFIVALTGLISATIIGYVAPVLIYFKVMTFKKLWDDFKSAFTGRISFVLRLFNIFNLLFPMLIIAFGTIGFLVGVPLEIYRFVNK